MSVIITAADPFGAMAARSFDLLGDITPGHAQDNSTAITNGKSMTNLVIKIVSGIGATFAIIGTSYVVGKKSMKYVNRLPTESIVFGQESDFCHTITRLKPGNRVSVQLLRDGKSLPAAVLLPDWLIYDHTDARLTIDATTLKEQDGLIISRWTVLIKNKGGCANLLIWEEFDIKFITQFNSIADDHSRKKFRSTEMGLVNSSNKQLQEPLISTP